MLSYKRSVRVAEQVQQEISRIVQELKNAHPALGFVTITGIRMSDDLRSARVFYSVIGSEQEVKESSSIIDAAVPEIRHQLAVRLNMRRTPTLQFDYDTTPQKAARVFELLEKIKSEETDEKK
jgi:ribosome-binding factor A